MLFKGRFDRAINWIKERRGDRERAIDNSVIENIVEKSDTFAMIIAALIVILPIALIFLVALALIAYFFVVRGG